MQRFCKLLPVVVIATLALSQAALAAEPPLKILIIGGQNNHNWARSTPEATSTEP